MINSIIQTSLLKFDKAYAEVAFEYQVKMSMMTPRLLNSNMNKFQLEELRIDTIEQMQVLGGTSNSFISMFIGGLINSAIVVLFLALIYSLFIGAEKMSLSDRLKRINI